MSFIAGAYTASWNAADVGRTERGWEVNQSYHQQTVLTDSFGDQIVDQIQQGVDTDILIEMVEYDLLVAALYAQTGGAGLGNAKVGVLLSTLAKQLVLTPITGTSAATSGKTWTFPLTYVADNFSILLSSKLRKGPVRFRALPALSTGIVYTQA